MTPPKKKFRERFKDNFVIIFWNTPYGDWHWYKVRKVKKKYLFLSAVQFNNIGEICEIDCDMFVGLWKDIQSIKIVTRKKLMKHHTRVEGM
jgi:hypothetical protein